MPVFQIDVEKHIGPEYWTNVYHVVAASQAEANTIADPLTSDEALIHYSNVVYDKVLIRPYPVVAGDYVEIALPFTGQRVGSADLPLFNVARFVFAATTGKPGIKMYRGALAEADLGTLGQLTDAARIFFTDWGVTFFTDVPEICKANGVPIGPGRPNLAIGMRQLRRGSKRPILP